MFERFTERARRAIILAQEEAKRLRHNAVGTEH
ncbi:MAG: Clp protease, partial [Bacillati bacterium ANGP1]